METSLQEALPVLWRSDPEGQTGGRWAMQNPESLKARLCWAPSTQGRAGSVSWSTGLQETAAWLLAADTRGQLLAFGCPQQPRPEGILGLGSGFSHPVGSSRTGSRSGGFSTTGVGVNSQAPSGPEGEAWVQTGDSPAWEHGRSQAVWEGGPRASLCGL